MSKNYYNPVTIHVGDGSLAKLPELVGERRVALVTFPEAKALGMIDTIRALLPGQVNLIIDNVLPNPDVIQLNDLYDSFWQHSDDYDLIVALGGGSSIDTAKTLMVGTESGKFADLLAILVDGKPYSPARKKPLITIPTTAGTGSEVTPWATIWDAAQQKKYSLHLDCTWPSAAIVDPRLMLSLPREVTISTGLDALSHALESIWNVHANPISDCFAISAIEDIFECLIPLVKRPDDIGLRTRMAQAALKAGMAFSNTKTALAHSISYDMTLRHGLAHGIACSFTLPLVLGMAWGKRADRDFVLQRLFGPDLGAAQERLRDFLHQLGVKTEFSDFGISDAESANMTRRAMEGPRGRNFIGSTPRATVGAAVGPVVDTLRLPKK
jgi:phosphonate metabolism-associated iron-containing alcohol dehydrogenase